MTASVFTLYPTCCVCYITYVNIGKERRIPKTIHKQPTDWLTVHVSTGHVPPDSSHTKLQIAKHTYSSTAAI